MQRQKFCYIRKKASADDVFVTAQIGVTQVQVQVHIFLYSRAQGGSPGQVSHSAAEKAIMYQRWLLNLVQKQV